MNKIKIAERWIGDGEPTYFVADIAANHDGDLERAKKLIYLAKESGADAAKFQNFTAPKIVSKYGFESLRSQMSHQSKWKKSVFEVYQDASIPQDWTQILFEYCREIGIHYFSTPYDFGAVDMLDPYVPAYKIGSGDITWLEMLEKIAGKGKPVLLATGASEMGEIIRAVEVICAVNPALVLMQCNTNYTASLENFKHIQLNVLKTYRDMYPALVLGLSDHTPGHATVLGAVALGARVIEKHFTDDINRAGPDHAFSLYPKAWREMVNMTRELESALGTGVKRIEENENETVILQRRSLRARVSFQKGHLIVTDDFVPLRPCPKDALQPYDIQLIKGKSLRRDIVEGDYLSGSDIE